MELSDKTRCKLKNEPGQVVISKRTKAILRPLVDLRQLVRGEKTENYICRLVYLCVVVVDV